MHTLPQYIDKYFQKFSKNIYFQPDTTYSQAYEIIEKRAAYIQSLGVKPKDTVALIASNSEEWMLTYLGIVYAGAIVVALDNHLSLDIHKKMLEKIDCKLAFVSDDLGYKSDEDVKFISVELSGALADEKDYVVPVLDKNEAVAYLFTSGTTGDPKIVMLSHDNIVSTCIAGLDHMELNKEPDVVLSVLPLYHVFGVIVCFLAFIANGSSMVVQPSLQGPDIIKSLEAYPVTVFPGVPKLWELFFDSIMKKTKNASIAKYHILNFMVNNAHILKAMGLGFLPKIIFKPIHKVFGVQMKFFVSGGAALNPKYFKNYHNMGFNILEGYGLTETTAAIVATKSYENTPGSVGKPTNNNFVEIRKADNRGIGEIWLKGVSVMLGYLNNDKANAEVFDADGWFDSGDIGRINKDGNLQITGRTKNIIVLDSGKNVFPEEVESFLSDSDLIEELAVFGHKKGASIIVQAVIVPKDISSSFQTIKEEVNRINNKLPDYMRVTEFAMSFDPLPRTSSKKVIIREVATNLHQGSYQTADNEDFTESHQIKAASVREQLILNSIIKRFGVPKLYLSHSLDDLGLDSLTKIHWVVELERELMVKVDMEKFMSISLVIELFKYLASLPEQTEVESKEDELISGAIKTKKYSFFNPIASLLVDIIRIKAKLFLGYKFIGKEKLVGLEDCIVVCNHQSNLDALLILGSLPAKLRNNVFMIGKQEVSFLKVLFPYSHTIFVDRGANVFPALKGGADILRQGGSLIIFPEGTRTRDGQVGDFKDGAAYLASKFNKNIVAMTINGAYKAFPKGKFLPKIGSKISVTVGDIISSNDKTVEDINAEIKKSVEKSLLK